MEKAVFDQYVEGVQTRIDTETPPEMRWLVMFPKLAPHRDGSLLQERFRGAVQHEATGCQQWLERTAVGGAVAPPPGADRRRPWC